MVDKGSFDAAQNAAPSTREAADIAKDYIGKGVDAAGEYASRGYGATREYAGGARDYANKGYDAAREYTTAGLDAAARMTGDLTEFIRNEPWIAIAAAFAVGYLTARIMRRLSI